MFTSQVMKLVYDFDAKSPVLAVEAWPDVDRAGLYQNAT